MTFVIRNSTYSAVNFRESLERLLESEVLNCELHLKLKLVILEESSLLAYPQVDI